MSFDNDDGAQAQPPLTPPEARPSDPLPDWAASEPPTPERVASIDVDLPTPDLKISSDINDPNILLAISQGNPLVMSALSLGVKSDEELVTALYRQGSFFGLPPYLQPMMDDLIERLNPKKDEDFQPAKVSDEALAAAIAATLAANADRAEAAEGEVSNKAASTDIANISMDDWLKMSSEDRFAIVGKMLDEADEKLKQTTAELDHKIDDIKQQEDKYRAEAGSYVSMIENAKNDPRLGGQTPEERHNTFLTGFAALMNLQDASNLSPEEIEKYKKDLESLTPEQRAVAEEAFQQQQKLHAIQREADRLKAEREALEKQRELLEKQREEIEHSRALLEEAERLKDTDPARAEKLRQQALDVLKASAKETTQELKNDAENLAKVENKDHRGEVFAASDETREMIGQTAKTEAEAKVSSELSREADKAKVAVKETAANNMVEASDIMELEVDAPAVKMAVAPTVIQQDRPKTIDASPLARAGQLQPEGVDLQDTSPAIAANEMQGRLAKPIPQQPSTGMG